MKKFFFFKSSSSSNPENNHSDSESKSQAAEKARAKNESQGSVNSPSLRRSRSYSSGAPYDAQQNLNFLNTPTRRTSTPERQTITKWFEEENPQRIPISVSHYDLSETSSNSSSSKVLDRFIDGEQQEEKIKVKSRSHALKRPPRFQYQAPTSPNDIKQKPKSQSFREIKGNQQYFSTGEYSENIFGQESPRMLAKHVIERLSQSRHIPRASSKEFDPDLPITIEDIYGRSLNGPSSSDPDGILDRRCKEEDDDSDDDMHRKSKEMKEWAMYLSDKLETDDIFEDEAAFSVPKLVQRVRNLTEEKINMALEASAMLDERTAERAMAREDIKALRAELDSRTRKLEKEKNEVQFALEKELDRRSNEWLFKLEKYQAEENRLRERVRELAEQNVSLQREKSTLDEQDSDSQTRLKELSSRIEQVSEENHNLTKNLSELRERHRGVEEDSECIRKIYEEKEKECKDLNRSITRFVRNCSEQEKTINGLREGLNEEIKKKISPENLAKLQMEQLRLTGVELAIRKEVDSYKNEVDSLRRENVALLHRLKANGMEGKSNIKLDQELWERVRCLENEGLTLINESSQLSSKMLDFVKVQASNASSNQGLDGQFVIESDVKIKGFKRGAGNLVWSLRNVSAVLHQKSNSEDDKCSDDNIMSELKAETLLTRLLREKLYSKDLEFEQIEAELAAAVRGNDILKCEVQNAMDSLSCVIHKMKDLELQLMKKDENINRLQNDLQECSKELSIIRGLLPKITEERDMLWEEVKQYSEKTMLLNSQVDAQKKKIESLDEDILIKEGQITILKDTIGKPFDLLDDREFGFER